MTGASPVTTIYVRLLLGEATRPFVYSSDWACPCHALLRSIQRITNLKAFIKHSNNDQLRAARSVF